ncbi:Signal recognition particle, subunit Ffh SRP54 (TC 3.A.5.1.1) [hydrothermal vent metagenome]|uniref:signal-recognition-particle GTPase n=1 Tax=hydrothermal vent metagenome TaxID=652676 RepID=A0A1W1CEU4_9ZZZZ
MFDNLKDKLNLAIKTVQGKKTLSEKNIADALREVRRSLLEADVALEVIKAFITQVEQKLIGQKVADGLTPSQMFIKLVEQELVEIMGVKNDALNLKAQAPAVVMVVGLQGAGKTTSLAKLAVHLKQKEKKKVLLVSSDVYRPAAIEQLKLLAEQTEIDFFPSDISQKPEKIVRDAKEFASKNYFDVLLVDTAGRLHIDDEMMSEVKTLQKSVNPIETLFVIDSMMGQEALRTAKAFADVLPLTGIILTKVDADARGGAALSAKFITGKPIKFLGVGEKVDALESFHPDRIVSKLLGMGDILSLVEDIEQKIDKKKSLKTAKKILKGKFSFEDMKEQLLQMKSMGGMESVLDKMPGMGNIPDNVKNKILDEKKSDKFIVIISSMTKKERYFPNLLKKASRKKRIADGSGTTLQNVNQCIKEFEKMQKMMKKMKGGKMKKMMQKMQGIKGMENMDMEEMMKQMGNNGMPI